MVDLESRYKTHGKTILIEIKLKNLMQLFNSFDPSPFHEKDLDDDAEEYIVSTVQEFPQKTPMRLVIHLPHDQALPEPQETVIQGIQNFFDYRTQVTDREFRHKLRQGRISLMIGMAFLFACISGRQFVAGFGGGTVYEIVQEGLLISGWVAMWRPIQIFLYDWWPLRKRRRLYHKLSHMNIEIRT
jgi:hypothetical protein